MDVEGFKKELSSRMGRFIEWEHTKMSTDPAERAAAMGKFRQELKTTITNLMNERKIEFNHEVQLGNFMSQLNPLIEELMNKYITG